VPSEIVVLVNVRRLAIYWRIPCARECGPNAIGLGCVHLHLHLEVEG